MSNKDLGRPIKILLVEDDPGDVRLVKESLKANKMHNSLSVVEDGEEAMNYLQKRAQYESATRPDLILLDLNLPRKDGRQVLAEIKADKKLKMIPVVILTTSKAEQDIIKTYELHANCYVTKPVGFDQFTEVVKNIKDFWFTIVELPGEEN